MRTTVRRAAASPSAAAESSRAEAPSPGARAARRALRRHLRYQRDVAALPSIHRPGIFENVRRETGLDPGVVRALRNALYKRGVAPEDALAALEPRDAAAIGPRVSLRSLDEMERRPSATDGATKLALRTRDGHLVEAVVLRIRSGRSAVCVSSQSGCAVRCAFCATGHMRTVRNLAVDEILEQVALAGHILRAEGRRLRNVVFMGMGEPMHNRAAVEEAVACLCDPGWFALSPRHVTVSTIGVVDGLVAFAKRFPDVRVAVSLHAARAEVRARLVPPIRGAGLAELRAALHAIARVRRGPVMIEYLLLDGVNDGDDDRAALVAFCRGLAVHVNLIPYNPITAAEELRGSPPDRQRAFADGVAAAGLRVTTRVSLGRDIAAACGQLVAPARATA